MKHSFHCLTSICMSSCIFTVYSLFFSIFYWCHFSFWTTLFLVCIPCCCAFLNICPLYPHNKHKCLCTLTAHDFILSLRLSFPWKNIFTPSRHLFVSSFNTFVPVFALSSICPFLHLLLLSISVIPPPSSPTFPPYSRKVARSESARVDRHSSRRRGSSRVKQSRSRSDVDLQPPSTTTTSPSPFTPQHLHP